jgi:hypothetical protein
VKLFGWEKADTWELWQAEQAIHVMGSAPDAMYIAPHQVGEAEWEQAADQAYIERALHQVGMPPAKAMRELDVDGDKVVAVTGDMEIWHLTLLGEAVIAAVSAGTEPDELMAVAADLPGTLCWALIHLKAHAAEMMRELGVDAVTVQFSFTEVGESPLEFAGITADSRISLTWTAELPEVEMSSPGWLQRRLGEVLTEGLGQFAGADGDTGREAVDQLAAQWETVPPVFALTQEAAPQRAQHPPGHRPSPLWARSQARRRLAEHLRNTGEEPRTMRGAEAMTFETQTVAPWLMDQARAALSHYSATAVVWRAGAELEAVTARRQQARRERQWHPHVWKSPGTVERADQADSELAGQRAVLAALLEFTLAEPPSGAKKPDEIEWATLLGLADLYVHATIRSDGLRWNTNGEGTEITEHYEVIQAPGGTPLLDLAAFDAARIHATRATAGCLVRSSRRRSG